MLRPDQRMGARSHLLAAGYEPDHNERASHRTPTPGQRTFADDHERWRWDLNPRTGYPVTRFRGVLLWPLGHATVGEITRAGAPQRNRAGSVSTPARGFRRSPRPDAWPGGRVQRPKPTRMRRTSGPRPPAPNARSAPASAPLRT